MATILKKATPSDTELIVNLGRETYYDAFHAVNSEETMSLYLAEAFNETKIGEELMHPGSEFHILYREGEPAGYIKVNLSSAQSDIKDPESLELERIYVRQRFKGLGCGRVLMEEAFSIARNKDCSYIWLGVWEKNSAALAFYSRMGFVKFGGHQFRMGDELQDDFLLKRKV